MFIAEHLSYFVACVMFFSKISSSQSRLASSTTVEPPKRRSLPESIPGPRKNGLQQVKRRISATIFPCSSSPRLETLLEKKDLEQEEETPSYLNQKASVYSGSIYSEGDDWKQKISTYSESTFSEGDDWDSTSQVLY